MIQQCVIPQGWGMCSKDMPYIGTVILHLVHGLLAFFSVIYLFYWRENFSHSSLKEYFVWFLSFFLYNIVLVVTVLVSPEISTITGIGYRISLFLLAFGVWQAFLAGLDFAQVSKGLRKTLSRSFLIGILLATALHVVFFELPQAASEHWILWSPNQPVAFSYIAFTFIAGWTVVFTIGRNMLLLKERALRFRAGSIALGAFLLPFAALLYFSATTLLHIYVSIGVVIVALLFFLLGNVGVRFLKKEESSQTD